MIGIQDFATLIRNRRRQLNLTQDEVARRIGASIPYVGHLEANRRHPSEKIVIRLAKVLGLDPRELFFLANPETKVLVSEKPTSSEASAWDAFSTNPKVRKIHSVTGRGMETYERGVVMGDVRSSEDFIFSLNTIRHALGK